MTSFGTFGIIPAAVWLALALPPMLDDRTPLTMALSIGGALWTLVVTFVVKARAGEGIYVTTISSIVVVPVAVFGGRLIGRHVGATDDALAIGLGLALAIVTVHLVGTTLFLDWQESRALGRR